MSRKGLIREKTIEQKLCTAVRARGGVALKFVSPGTAGVPDRLVLFPGGRMAFVEVKAPGRKLRPLQHRRAIRLIRMGFRVYVLDREEQIPALVMEILQPAACGSFRLAERGERSGE